MGTVSNEAMQRYLETYRDAYLRSADQFIDEASRTSLVRYQLLAGKTIGYVSTQFGAAFEYVQDARGPSITVVSGSPRVEDLLVDSPSRFRSLPPAAEGAGHDAILLNCGFLGPIRLLSDDASVRLIDCHFFDQSWRRDIIFAEVYGNRTEEFWSPVEAVARAKDEVFVAATQLQEARRQSLGLYDYLTDFKRRRVLVLGDFGEGRERLTAMKDALTALGYDALTMDEIPDILDLNLSQKALLYSGLSRFVVVDDSSKSGHLVEMSKLEESQAVTVVLRLEGSAGTMMTKGMSSYSNVVYERPYTADSLAGVMREACSWAEGKLAVIHGLWMRPIHGESHRARAHAMWSSRTVGAKARELQARATSCLVNCLPCKLPSACRFRKTVIRRPARRRPRGRRLRCGGSKGYHPTYRRREVWGAMGLMHRRRVHDSRPRSGLVCHRGPRGWGCRRRLRHRKACPG